MDDYYLINRCITNTAIQKGSCYIKDGRLYSNEICNFYLVSYKESDEEYLNYLNKDNFEPDSFNKDCVNYCVGRGYIDMGDNGEIYEILSLDYFKELEYNACDAEYQKWLSGEDE